MARRAKRSVPTPVEHLSDEGLLSVLVGRRKPVTGVGEPSQPYLPESLVDVACYTGPQLQRQLGFTPKQARLFLAAVELHRRLLQPPPKRASLRNPELVAQLMKPFAILDCEHFWCLPLNARTQIIGEPVLISKGDVDGTSVEPRTFMRTAVLAGATSVIAVHNHPSGDVMASQADRGVTKKLVVAGMVLGIPLVDHVIISRATHYSIRLHHASLFEARLP